MLPVTKAGNGHLFIICVITTVLRDTPDHHRNKTRSNHLLWAGSQYCNCYTAKRTGRNLPAFPLPTEFRIRDK